MGNLVEYPKIAHTQALVGAAERAPAMGNADEGDERPARRR
jgi:hypothetical protein